MRLWQSCFPVDCAKIYKKTCDGLLLMQWCNLTLARWFWATKVCLRASKISKICQFGRSTGRETFWKANFENYSRYYLVKWHQFVSILYSMSNTFFRFKHTFLLSGRSSQSHKVMPHHARVSCLIIEITINAIE